MLQGRIIYSLFPVVILSSNLSLLKKILFPSADFCRRTTPMLDNGRFLSPKPSFACAVINNSFPIADSGMFNIIFPSCTVALNFWVDVCAGCCRECDVMGFNACPHVQIPSKRYNINSLFFFIFSLFSHAEFYVVCYSLAMLRIEVFLSCFIENILQFASPKHFHIL